MQPCIKVAVRATHPKLCFSALGLFIENGGGLKLRESSEEEDASTSTSLVDVYPHDLIFYPDDTTVQFYIGDPSTDETLQGCFALRLSAKQGGLEPDADTYVGVAYHVSTDPEDPPKYYMTLTETEPGVDMILYYQPLRRAYLSNWKHQLSSESLLKHACETMGQAFVVKTRLGVEEDCVTLEVELAEPDVTDCQFERQLYLAVAPLPQRPTVPAKAESTTDAVEHKLSRTTSFGEDTNTFELNINEGDVLHPTDELETEPESEEDEPEIAPNLTMSEHEKLVEMLRQLQKNTGVDIRSLSKPDFELFDEGNMSLLKLILEKLRQIHKRIDHHLRDIHALDSLLDYISQVKERLINDDDDDNEAMSSNTREIGNTNRRRVSTVELTDDDSQYHILEAAGEFFRRVSIDIFMWGSEDDVDVSALDEIVVDTTCKGVAFEEQMMMRESDADRSTHISEVPDMDDAQSLSELGHDITDNVASDAEDQSDIFEAIAEAIAEDTTEIVDEDKNGTSNDDNDGTLMGEMPTIGQDEQHTEEVAALDEEEKEKDDEDENDEANTSFFSKHIAPALQGYKSISSIITRAVLGEEDDAIENGEYANATRAIEDTVSLVDKLETLNESNTANGQEHISITTEASVPADLLEVTEISESGDAALICFSISHTDILLRHPHFHVMSGHAKGDPPQLIDAYVPGSARYTADNERKSRGVLIYEVVSRHTHNSEGTVRSRKERVYLVIAWQFNPKKVVTEKQLRAGKDPRYLFSVTVLRSNHPGFPTRDFVQRRVFEKLSFLTLAQASHEWRYDLPDGEQFMLDVTMRPLYSQRNICHLDEDTDKPNDLPYTNNPPFSPAILQLKIERVDETDTVYLGPALFFPASGYHWRVYDSMLRINKFLKSAEDNVANQVLLLIENTNKTPCELHRIYEDVGTGRLLSKRNRHLSAGTFDLYTSGTDTSNSMLRVIYAIQSDTVCEYDTPTTVRANIGHHYLVASCSFNGIQANIVNEWIQRGGNAVTGSEIISFLNDANTSAMNVPGCMIRSNHLIFDTTFLRVEQYRNFGDPHVATITVEDAQFAENSVPYEEDFEPTLYIEFTNNCSLLEIGSIRTISTGWNLASFTEANTDADADDINHMTWEFSDLPVLHGEGRAVRIRLVSECAQEAGDLDSIEINVSAFPDERGASQNFSAYVTLYEKFKVYERSYDNMDPLDALLEKINDQYDPEISRYMRLAQENTSHQQKTDEQYLDINSARTRRTCSSSRIVCVRDGQRCSINTYLERSKNETGAIFHIVINEMVTEEPVSPIEDPYEDTTFEELSITLEKVIAADFQVQQLDIEVATTQATLMTTGSTIKIWPYVGLRRGISYTKLLRFNRKSSYKRAPVLWERPDVLIKKLNRNMPSVETIKDRFMSNAKESLWSRNRINILSLSRLKYARRNSLSNNMLSLKPFDSKRTSNMNAYNKSIYMLGSRHKSRLGVLGRKGAPAFGLRQDVAMATHSREIFGALETLKAHSIVTAASSHAMHLPLSNATISQALSLHE